MAGIKITHPNEVLQLTAAELFERVRPILRHGGLTSSQQEFARANVTSICWELGQRWQKDPHLGQRKVDFGEFLATTLANAVRALQRQHEPDCYDPHGRNVPDREPLELDPEHAAANLEAPLDLLISSESSGIGWHDRLAQTAEAARVAPASTNALLQQMRDIESRKINSSYRLARDQGLSPTEARYQPATAAFTAITDYLQPYIATTASL